MKMPKIKQTVESKVDDVLLQINLPLYVTLPRKRVKSKRFALNLNIYRNTHFQVLNQAKKIFAYHVKSYLTSVCFSKPYINVPVVLEYTLYRQNKRTIDLSNVISVIDKFTQDVLVDMGILRDDSVDYIKRISFEFGGIDKDSPRCELRIKSY